MKPREPAVAATTASTMRSATPVSIKTRILALILLGMTVVLSSAGVALDARLTSQLVTAFDAGLLTKSRALTTLTVFDDGAVEFDFADEFMPEFSRPSQPEYFQLTFADGRVMETARSLRDAMLPIRLPLSETPYLVDVRLPDGRPGRLLQVTFVPHADDDADPSTAAAEAEPLASDAAALAPDSADAERMTLIVARGREQLDLQLRDNRHLLIAAFLALMAISAGVVFQSVRIGLRPLRELAVNIKDIDDPGEGQRIRSIARSSETQPIVDQINKLLDRLEQVFVRERRFSSDVAHELRTPIAELKSLAEVGQISVDDRATVIDFFASINAVTVRMERTVSALLLLARVDSGAVSGAIEDCNIAEMIRDCWHGLDQQDIDSATLCNRVEPDLVLASVPTSLGLMLVNLLSNAARHSPVGTQVEVSAQTEADGRVTLVVANDCDQLTVADLEKIKDRFWQKDAARTDPLHSGLGLSVVDGLAALLGLQLHLDLTSATRFEARLQGLSRSV